jgi:hypothetical protein
MLFVSASSKHSKASRKPTIRTLVRCSKMAPSIHSLECKCNATPICIPLIVATFCTIRCSTISMRAPACCHINTLVVKANESVQSYHINLRNLATHVLVTALVTSLSLSVCVCVCVCVFHALTHSHVPLDYAFDSPLNISSPSNKPQQG